MKKHVLLEDRACREPADGLFPRRDNEHPRDFAAAKRLPRSFHFSDRLALGTVQPGALVSLISGELPLDFHTTLTAVGPAKTLRRGFFLFHTPVMAPSRRMVLSLAVFTPFYAAGFLPWPWPWPCNFSPFGFSKDMGRGNTLATRLQTRG